MKGFEFVWFLICFHLFYVVFATGYGNPQGYVCSSKGSVVGAIITVLLLQMGLAGSFWFFYQTKQRQWAKASGFQEPHSLHSSHPHSPSSTANFSTSPEVIFRSVYDRLSRRPFLIPFPNTQSQSSSSGVGQTHRHGGVGGGGHGLDD